MALSTAIAATETRARMSAYSNMVCPSSGASKEEAADRAEKVLIWSLVITGFSLLFEAWLPDTARSAAATRRDGWAFQSDWLFDPSNGVRITVAAVPRFGVSGRPPVPAIAELALARGRGWTRG